MFLKDWRQAHAGVKRRVSEICFVLLLVASAGRAGGLDTPAGNPAAGNPAATPCIASPEEWQQHWDQSKWKCVDPSLFGTVIFPAGPGSEVENTYLYPCSKGGKGGRCESGFWYAWAFSSTNLEQALELKVRYSENTTKVSSAIFSLVGFSGVEDFDSSTLVYLGVYTLPPNEGPLVPTWQTWFRLLDELAAETSSLQVLSSNKDIQARLLQAQQDLSYAYSVLTRDDPKSRHEDVLAAYEVLSGCPREVLIAAPESDYLGLGVAPNYPTQKCTQTSLLCWSTFDKSCAGANYPQYKQFLIEARLKSPYTDSEHAQGADSKVCFVRALEYLQEHPEMISATTLRAMLAQCQDANGLNTGAGLGYNTYPNPTSYENQCGGYWDPTFKPKEQTVLQRFTGREFIVANRKLNDHPEYAHVQLVFGDEKERPYLIQGYCTE